MTASLKTEWLEEPRRRCWTVEEFHQAANTGIFGQEEHLELIQGEIFTKMPQNSPHSSGISATEEVLRQLLPVGHYIRIQMPITLGEISQPDPDIAIVIGRWQDYVQSHPTMAVLLVEVSDSTLTFDRTTKASLYAEFGIPEYWIVNLRDRQLEVHREPGEVDGNYQYGSVIHYSPTDFVTPLFAAYVTIDIATLLPPSL